MSDHIPLPMCVVNANGKIVDANTHINEVFLYDGIAGQDIFVLTGIKIEQLQVAIKEDTPLHLSRNNKTFRILASLAGEGDGGEVNVYFIDITTQKEVCDKYRNERTCIAVVDVDNYDELISSMEENMQATLTSEIDRRIRLWGSKMEASVTRVSDHGYMFIFEKQSLDQEERSRFNILDDIREIETEADFPVTLSIGVGVGGETLDETDHYSLQALDVAKGRGGDQAVVKVKDNLSYYGGKTQSVEKGNKGKSRIIGHALRGLMESASNVIIMGHRNPDMDSFGSALGLYRLAKTCNREAYILVDNYNEGLEVIYQTAVDTGDYSIIKSRKALSMVEDRTLVIVVDTHKPSMVECPQLLEKAARVVVIDHHRKAAEAIENPTLTYMETYASSTAELVTEILQYTLERKALEKMDANALLAGITVDTNRFSVKTGVRTFEAAAWLKRAGADTAEVKRLFQSNMDTFRVRASCIASAQIEPEGTAYSICDGFQSNAQIICSQVADELLTVRGVKASFVAGRNESGGTVVSARSIGDVNVQVVMEEFGGGGHLNTAGAQMDVCPEEVIERIKEIMERNK
ncbi:MAG: DHH family phosphoesterase [Anaerovoracaceae bacterium]|jgi:c-di-AMP phosphodiesterase-like protein